MKKIILTSALLLACTAAGVAKSPKRGVSENEFRYLAQAEALAPGVSWYYTWGNTPHNSTAGYSDMEFVPMCWNGGFNAQAIRDYCKENPGVRYLLGFNEPNFVHQSNMTPQEAAEKWPEVQALAKELDLKIVAPALNYSPDTWQPVAWMDEFIRLVGPDAFDYTAIHSYGGTGVMKDLATQFHDRYGKDVWVTEFCYWPGESGYVAPATQISAMIESVSWLEKTPWIYRYAWFKSVGSSESSSGPNYGLLKPGRGDDERELSAQGYVYVYMSEFDTDHFNAVDETFAATDYIDATGVTLGKGANPSSTRPIDITGFTSGATVSWQFDVPESGDYTLRLMVSGEGEPKRFDPSLALFTVEADGKEGRQLCDATRFGLSGDDGKYAAQDFNITLEAGKQTLRLKDMGPFQPSGIHISTVTLYKGEAPDAGAVMTEADAADAPVEIYTLQGMKVREPVPGEIYICRQGTRSWKGVCRR